jgi:hypothetical protein
MCYKIIKVLIMPLKPCKPPICTVVPPGTIGTDMERWPSEKLEKTLKNTLKTPALNSLLFIKFGYSIELL